MSRPSGGAGRGLAGLPEPLVPLALGIPLALLLAFAPLLEYMGWFLRSLVHEMGHTAAGWFAGCPTWPAIRLDGHAAAFHRPQVTVLALAVWAALLYLAWRFRGPRRPWLLPAVTAVGYPVLVFTGVREIFHLTAGHLGELVFAAIFFRRALRGGSARPGERPLYAALGWYWTAGSLWLFGSLVLSEAGRRWYLSHGSFGMANDFVRISRLLHVPLSAAAFPMLLLSLLPLPAAWLLAGGRSGAGDARGLVRGARRE